MVGRLLARVKGAGSRSDGRVSTRGAALSSHCSISRHKCLPPAGVLTCDSLVRISAPMNAVDGVSEFARWFYRVPVVVGTGLGHGSELGAARARGARAPSSRQ